MHGEYLQISFISCKVFQNSSCSLDQTDFIPLDEHRPMCTNIKTKAHERPNRLCSGGLKQGRQAQRYGSDGLVEGKGFLIRSRRQEMSLCPGSPWAGSTQKALSAHLFLSIHQVTQGQIRVIVVSSSKMPCASQMQAHYTPESPSEYRGGRRKPGDCTLQLHF